MPYVYEGLATVIVAALYPGQEPNELTTLELPVQIHNEGPGRFRLSFGHYLQGPKDANALRAVLPDGRLLQGAIVDGRNEPAGGWLLIDIERHELGPDKPTSRSDWKWE